MNSVFVYLINTKLYIFSFLAAGFCPKNLAFARKIMVLPESGGLQPPSPPGSYAYANKSPSKILDKRQRRRIQGLPTCFWIFCIISGTGKAMNFKFCSHIHRINRNKSPLKISEKVAVGVLRDCRKFSGQRYIGRIARSSLR